MNTQLEPPPVPPLTTSQRARLRDQVMDGAAPPSVRRSHRWTVPAISVAATALVVAGALVIGNQVPDPGSGNPPVGGSVSTNTGAPTLAGINLDRGPASAAEVAKVIQRCEQNGVKHSQALWSRRVVTYAGGKPRSAVVVLLKSTPGQPGGYYDLGLATCLSSGAFAAVRDTTWKKVPNRTEGLVTLSSMGRIGGAGPTKPTYASNEAIHRVRPEISRIESRYRWKGGAGQWYQGVVTGGFAYTASTAEIPPGVYTPPNPGASEDKNPVKEEIRAFDSLGNPVPVKN